MGRLDDVVAGVLSRPGSRAAPGPDGYSSEPRPVASWVSGDRGAVLLLVRRGDGSLHAVVAAATRVGDTWDVEATAGAAWLESAARPRDLVVTAVMELSGLAIAVGAAPAGVDAVTEGSRSFPVEPTTGAFIVVAPGGSAGTLTVRL